MPGKKSILIIITIIFTIGAASNAAAIENQLIGNVWLTTMEPTAPSSPGATINFQLRKTAELDLFICDLDGRIVSNLLTDQKFESGDHTATWDGSDNDGDACLPGAYIPIINARHDTLGHEIYNPTQNAWGHWVTAEDVAYEPTGHIITYTLPSPAICLIRAGVGDGGPLYKTIAQWVPRQSGNHKEFCDGMDESNAVEAYKSEKFRIVIDAMSLPDNTIMHSGNTNTHKLNDKPYPIFPLSPPTGKEIFIHSLHPRHSCVDFNIDVNVLEEKIRSDRKVSGTLQLEVDAIGQHAADLLKKEGFECYLFADEKLIYEMRFNTLPVHLAYDTNKTGNGKHVFTVNLRSIEDHLGTFSMRVIVKN